MSDFLDEEMRDCLQEISNVAVGQTANLLAQVLEAFVIMPIPVVNLLERSDLKMTLSSIYPGSSIQAVSQGFAGAKISGEALIIFNDADFKDVAKLTHYQGEITKATQLELVIDFASIMIGAYLNGIAEQMDVKFFQSQPYLLGEHIDISKLLSQSELTWKNLLAIEMPYKVEHHQIDCDFILLFSEDSLPVIKNKISYLLE